MAEPNSSLYERTCVIRPAVSHDVAHALKTARIDRPAEALRDDDAANSAHGSLSQFILHGETLHVRASPYPVADGDSVMTREASNQARTDSSQIADFKSTSVDADPTPADPIRADRQLLP
jgi:hypothetical protein